MAALSGVIPAPSKFAVAYNKLGIPVSYSLELSKDLLTIHGLKAKEIIENMYGTNFHIERAIHWPHNKTNLFVMTTNDDRDAPKYVWSQVT